MLLHTLDWFILGATLLLIVGYGTWKTRGSSSMSAYLRSDGDAKWWTIGLSVMATQASAITFLSTPGQAYAEGMGFVQFYFGLPIAMVIICVVFIPIFYRLKVYTAYEFLENRFDYKTRLLTSLFFLIQRGLAAGITIYAPAIILSTILGWELYITCLIIGILVIIYTVSGGTKAVSVTHKWQMLVIMLGMAAAFGLLIHYLPGGVGFTDALHVAGASDKLNILDFQFNLNERYTVWTGILAGLFLHLSYFGTDQSQVQRYLTGRSIRESRMGLIFNGLLKVPMQFFILLVGVMVFVFFQFQQAPLFFNPAGENAVAESAYAEDYAQLRSSYNSLQSEKEAQVLDFVAAKQSGNETRVAALRQGMRQSEERLQDMRSQAKAYIEKADASVETNDKDYVFIHFILKHLPVGLIGLLLAVIFSAAMSSTAAELNALASTSSVDIYMQRIAPGRSEAHYLQATRWLTLLWGAIAILFAVFGHLAENLIQYVNIVGSLFYGTVLGVFLIAFWVKYVKGTAIFIAALLAEVTVITIFLLKSQEISYMWYNVIGCLGVIVLAVLIQTMMGRQNDFE